MSYESRPSQRSPLPQPITVHFTVKEATHVHLLLDVLVKLSENGIQMPASFDSELTKRFCKELETKLKRAGCVLDELGWKV